MTWGCRSPLDTAGHFVLNSSGHFFIADVLQTTLGFASLSVQRTAPAIVVTLRRSCPLSQSTAAQPTASRSVHVYTH